MSDHTTWPEQGHFNNAPSFSNQLLRGGIGEREHGPQAPEGIASLRAGFLSRPLPKADAPIKINRESGMEKAPTRNRPRSISEAGNDARQRWGVPQGG